MKRKVLFILLAVGVVAMASAHGGKRGWGGGYGYPPVIGEAATVTGTLTIVQGGLAVKSGTITYMVPQLMRYVGFIDTLKEGAQVTITGTVAASPLDVNVKIMWPSRLTIGSKTFDLQPPQPAPGTAYYGWHW